MLILSVESTCDETAVALVRDGREVLTDQIFSQADLHAVYGGVVPEIASRSHVEVISRLADRAVVEAGVKKDDLDQVCEKVGAAYEKAIGYPCAFYVANIGGGPKEL